jgi:sodium-dependent dicarboxylate transporter 2/3/5
VSRTRVAGLVLGPLFFFALTFLDNPLHHLAGFDRRPALAAGISLLMATWWFTEAVAIEWTAMIPLVAFPLLNVFGGGVVNGVAKAGGEYTNAYIFLFLGGMAVGAALEHWNLHRRIALQLMLRIGASPPRLAARPAHLDGVDLVVDLEHRHGRDDVAHRDRGAG